MSSFEWKKTLKILLRRADHDKYNYWNIFCVEDSEGKTTQSIFRYHWNAGGICRGIQEIDHWVTDCVVTWHK